MAQGYGQSPPVGALSPSEAASKVELSISCGNLKDLDHFSRSDPCVFVLEQRGRDWVKLGRTEVIDNNLNPKFSKVFLLDYRFEEVQNLQFVVYDVDDKKRVDDVKRHDLIGHMECTMADIVTAGQQYTRNLRKAGTGEKRGTITVQAEEVQDSKFTITMQLAANKLDKKDLFGKSDPFIEVAKAQEGGAFTVVYRSQPIMKNLNPRWPEFVLPIRQLCSGDWDRTLKFTVYDWNRSGDHDFIGSATSALREICPERGGQVYTLDLINPEKKKKRKYTNSGTVTFIAVKATPIHSFVDYIKGGCQINLLVAIDFTASNGKQQLASSLHYNNPYQDNEYVQAIKSVASVLAPYDSDQLIPAFGFGARLPPEGRVSHCFPLTFNEARPEVGGVQGLLDAYRFALSRVDLYGPTNFSSFLDTAIQYATGGVTQDQQAYSILLIITDGVISDMNRTVDRIVDASKLPLSIVIVGVGGADFSNMEVLDADDNPLKNKYNEKMSRDIVQFVPLRAFQKQSGANFSIARETLAEIPDQFTSFMKVQGIKPNPPPLRKQRSSISVQPGQYPGQPGPYPGQPGPYPGQAYAGQQGGPYGGQAPGQLPYPSGATPSAPPGAAPSAPPGAAPSAPPYPI